MLENSKREGQKADRVVIKSRLNMKFFGYTRQLLSVYYIHLNYIETSMRLTLRTSLCCDLC